MAEPPGMNEPTLLSKRMVPLPGRSLSAPAGHILAGKDVMTMHLDHAQRRALADDILAEAAPLGEELTRIVAAGTGVDEHLDREAFRAIGAALARHLNDGLAAAIREGFRHSRR